MNAELEKKVRDKASDTLNDCDHVYYRNDIKGLSESGVCADCLAAALLKAYKEGRKEMREKALKKLQELRDSADAWEIGRFSVLSSAALAIRDLKEE